MEIPLKDLEVLVLDCQATGPHPGKGHLLEVGWVKTCASQAGDAGRETPEAYIVDLPVGEDVSGRVRAITGISDADLARSVPPSAVWEKLWKTAQETAGANSSGICTAVIHYARYERPFLAHLGAGCESESELPFDIVCTHEIAKRLLPGLPRRGMRAVAGYFGFSVPQCRRAEHHTRATVFIWRNLVKLLEEERRITTIGALRDWLKHTEAPSGHKRSFPLDPAKRSNLPDEPGVYRMLRSNGDTLYVGKAKSLKVRVGSYFQQKRHHPEHILEMLSQVSDLGLTVTGSALEAALLESDEVKRLSPPYNIALRERERRVVFFSKDLSRFTETPDEMHTVGPLPSPDTCIPLRVMTDLLSSLDQSTVQPAPIERILTVPEKYLPDPDCFSEGLAEFLRRHTEVTGTSPVHRGLLMLGRKLWLESFLELGLEETLTEDKSPANADDEQEAEEPGEWIWTPERVADSLEGVVRRGTHMIRRGRWFSLLCESSLAWQPVEDSGRVRTVIVVASGVIVDRLTHTAASRIPDPPGYRKLSSERQRCFDLPTYDRMRVLTTEIRRLIAGGRSVRLRLGPDLTLEHEKLVRLLRWV